MPYVARTEIVVEHFESKEIKEDGCTGHRSVSLGKKKHLVEITINIDQIIKDLGPRACRSKSGITKFMGGNVVVKRLS